MSDSSTLSVSVGNETISYGSTTGIDACLTTNTVTNCYPYTYSWYWPTCEDKGMKAFKVAKALQDKKIVKCNSVKQFIDLVDLLVKEL